LVIAGYNHLKRIGNPSVTKTFKKSNVLLIGSTGIGKTYLVENLGKILGVPFISVDGSSFTSAGYVGQSAEDVLRDLLDKAEGSLHTANIRGARDFRPIRFRGNDC
jgi:ATP-dependent protease Clp ATPase subunit